MIVDLIISGGQTGADQAGLAVAHELGIPTGGFAPRGYMTESGPCLSLRDIYGLEEMKTLHVDYMARTRKNIDVSDGTLIFGRRSPGSNRTEEYCRTQKKPYLWLLLPPDTVGSTPTLSHPKAVRLWLIRNSVKTLNVAGNRESKNPGIGDKTGEFLRAVLT